VVERSPSATVLRNYQGAHYSYPEPEETDCSCPYDALWLARGSTRPGW
jgi:lysine 2,3-aminomutase